MPLRLTSRVSADTNVYSEKKLVSDLTELEENPDILRWRVNEHLQAGVEQTQEETGINETEEGMGENDTERETENETGQEKDEDAEDCPASPPSPPL